MLKGIDISEYQTSTPSLDGLSFIVLRASIGGRKDAKYDTHYTNARKAGLVVMAYHFGVAPATLPIADQVAAFLASAKDADFLWIDQEADGFGDTQAKNFINKVHNAGRQIGLYHSLSGYDVLNADARWVAYWNSTPPSIGWDLWQSQGSPLDTDYLNPASPLAALLRKGYVTQATADKIAENSYSLGYGAGLAAGLEQGYEEAKDDALAAVNGIARRSGEPIA